MKGVQAAFVQALLLNGWVQLPVPAYPDLSATRL
jgi:hypothetical protein